MQPWNVSSFDAFFTPRSICLIGASGNPKKIGAAITQNLLTNPLKTYQVYLVSRKISPIFDQKVYSSILNVEVAIDLAIILIPASFIDDIIDECIQKAVKAIIIITAGFGEMGEEGKNKEHSIKNKLQKAHISLIGPNCVGIENVLYGLNASFIQTPMLGNISMVTQSGSFGAACIWEMNSQNLGMAKFLNLGNAADIDFHQVLEFYSHDPATEVVAIYIEAVKEGRSFFAVLKKLCRIKPVIILKGGKTGKGNSAAQSHTGSISNDYNIFKAMVNQAGGILCETMHDFLIALKIFSKMDLPKGTRIAVMTGSGGSGVLLSDFLEEYGLELSHFSKKLQATLKPHLVSFAKIENPLDMIASADESTFYHVSKKFFLDSDIDIIIAISLVPPFMDQSPESHMKGILMAWNEYNRSKPVIPVMVFGSSFKKLYEFEKKEDFPLFYSPHDAAYAVKLLIDRVKFLNSHKEI